MKIVEALKVIDSKWVEKKKGYRVQFKRFDGDAWIDDVSPPEDTSLLDSDVTAWRLAWKLAQCTPLHTDKPQEGDMADIRVVDHKGDDVVYYATGEKSIFNQMVKDNDNNRNE